MGESGLNPNECCSLTGRSKPGQLSPIIKSCTATHSPTICKFLHVILIRTFHLCASLLRKTTLGPQLRHTSSNPYRYNHVKILG